MEGGVPMLNCLLQHTLRSLCTFSSDSSKWVYAVFWKILPRIYPPPKWDHEGGLLDRAKGNKRNWNLVWEDGFCDFCECERAGNGYLNGKFGADIFFKMTHEVYNFGEGLVGKIAADNSHKWVFRDSPKENDTSFNISSWNVSIDPQPRAWEAQFNSGIETIAIISVKEGAIQLGSFDKVVEDLNLVLSIQRKFSYLQTIQRPYLTNQNPNAFHYNNSHVMTQTKGTLLVNHTTGSKRQNYKQSDGSHNGLPMLSIPPLFPSMSCNLGALLSRVPYEETDNHNTLLNNFKSRNGLNFDEKIGVTDVKVETLCVHEEKASPLDDGV